MNTPIATDFAAIAASMKEHANNSDAVLIQRCHRFAEAEITSWYRYVIAPAHLADEQDTPSDMAATIGLSQRPRRPPRGCMPRRWLCPPGTGRDISMMSR